MKIADKSSSEPVAGLVVEVRRTTPLDLKKE